MGSLDVRRSARLLLLTLGMCAASVAAAAQEPDPRTAEPRTDQRTPEPRTPEPPNSEWRSLLAHGDRASIERLAVADPSHPDLIVARALLARARGEDEGAIDALAAAADAGSPDAALELGLLYLQMGRRDEARAAFEPLSAALAPGDGGLAYARVGRAVAAIGDPRQANALFRAAAQRAPGEAVIYDWWGDLFLARHEDAEAARAYGDALARDARWAPAHLGLAAALASSDPEAAAASLERALAIDPGLVDAHLTLIDRAFDADRRDEAEAAIVKAEGAGPARYDVQVRRAVLALVDERQADFDALAAALQARRPSSGEVFRVAAAAAARQYRFDEAVALGRRATAADEHDTRAWAELGMHLSRAGDETGAYQALSRAFRADPYDPVTYNLLNMLETLSTFASVTHGVATIRLHPDERPLLEPYVVDLITRALDSFEQRYGVRPAAPLHVQLFNSHDDFAVRTAGLPGVLINALGVCFGRVVAMVSPRARTPGSFSWQETLWHELAHVVTLQASNQRVPRWLTEGISVYEERRARAGWGREGDLPFAQALAAGKALSLSDLEGGFMRPDTIGLAYYQASLLVEHIERTDGIEAIRRMLAAYGEGLATPAVVQRELGMDLPALDARFFTDVRARYEGLMRALAPLPSAAADGRAGAAPSDTLAGLLTMGDALLADGDPEGARAAFERAAALVPGAAGDLSPHLRLANLALASGDRARARRALAAALDADYANVEIARRLAALADEDNDAASSRLAWSRVIEIDPFDPMAHTQAGRAALAEGQLADAEREFRAAIAAGPVNPGDAHCDLGELFMAQGRTDEARRQAIRALENAPTFERAQTLLLRSVGRWP